MNLYVDKRALSVSINFHIIVFNNSSLLGDLNPLGYQLL